jgi:hypothetical protein
MVFSKDSSDVKVKTNKLFYENRFKSIILYRMKEKIVTILRVIDRKDLDRIIKRLKLSKS